MFPNWGLEVGCTLRSGICFAFAVMSQTACIPSRSFHLIRQKASSHVFTHVTWFHWQTNFWNWIAVLTMEGNYPWDLFGRRIFTKDNALCAIQLTKAIHTLSIFISCVYHCSGGGVFIAAIVRSYCTITYFKTNITLRVVWSDCVYTGFEEISLFSCGRVCRFSTVQINT